MKPVDDYHFDELGKLDYAVETGKEDKFFKKDSNGTHNELSYS